MEHFQACGQDNMGFMRAGSNQTWAGSFDRL
jgi:hypothetical protein